MKQYLEVFITPSCWLRSKFTCKSWDKLLNRLIDEAESGRLKIDLPYEMFDCLHEFRIGGIRIWVNNFPYAFGSMDGRDELPSRKTVFRLKKFLDSEFLKKAHNDANQTAN